MPRYTEKIERMTLPVIPLRGLVIFPSLPANFELGREMSIAAAEAASKNDKLVFLITQKEIDTEKPSPDDLFSVGTVARIRQSVNTHDGTVRIIAEGQCRAIAKSFVMHSGVMYADILAKTVTLGRDEMDIRCEALMDSATSTLEDILEYMPTNSTEIMITAKSVKNPGFLADLITSNVLTKFEDKQEILEIFEPLRRLEKLIIMLERQLKLMHLESDIQRKVRQQIDDNQRDYYLREQLKVLREELDGDGDSEIDEYTEKIKSANLPDYVREKLEKELRRMAKTPFGSPESTVIRMYIDACLEIPWTKSTKDRTDIDAARRILDKDHFGLEKPKQRILEYLAVRKLNPDMRHQIICLVGPPGVGKTSLGASIARAMNRKYVRVSLGGIRDEAEIRGHRKTYVGAMPGRIVTALSEAGVNNPVMLLDEIDKLCSDLHGDPASAMLEVLDGEQNSAFRDHFIEMPVDLSNCVFIATANELDTIPRPLLDRMEIIELNTYTKNEKSHIAKDHLIPKQLKRHGLTRRSLKISDDALMAIISGYTAESGVRRLEREIASICRKAAMRIATGEEKTVKVTEKNLSDFLGGRKILDEKLADQDEIGVVNGLAYTSVGGDLLKIETAVMNGTGKIELTGTLGDVMKESAHIAVSYIRVHSEELGIDPDFYKKFDLHIHVPEGAVPKDGPSAGVTLLTSLVSALSKKPVRRDIAMTGELTLTGHVLPIGGLREKTTAAWSIGVKRVLIPEANLSDLDEIDQDVRRGLVFVPCKTASDILAEAIVSSHASSKCRFDEAKPDVNKELPVPPQEIVHKNQEISICSPKR